MVLFYNSNNLKSILVLHEPKANSNAVRVLNIRLRRSRLFKKICKSGFCKFLDYPGIYNAQPYYNQLSACHIIQYSSGCFANLKAFVLDVLHLNLSD